MKQKRTSKAKKITPQKSVLPTDRDNFKIVIGPDGKISAVDNRNGYSLSDEKVGVKRMAAIRKEISPNLDETNFAVGYDYFPDPIEVYGINCMTGQRIPDHVVGLHRMECIRRIHENLFRLTIESLRNKIGEGARRGSWNLCEAIEWFFMKRDYMKEPDSVHQEALTRDVNAALAAHNDKKLSLSFVGSDPFVNIYDLIRWAATIEHGKDWHVCIELERHAAYMRIAPTLPIEEPTQEDKRNPSTLLTMQEKAVLNIIKGQPNGKPIIGKSIIAALEKDDITIEQSALTARLIPALKKAGFPVKNRRNVGYYLADDAVASA